MMPCAMPPAAVFADYFTPAMPPILLAPLFAIRDASPPPLIFAFHSRFSRHFAEAAASLRRHFAAA